MITTLLAIDVGGSTSRATLVDLEGNCLGQGRNRGGNPGSNPPAEAAAAVVAAAESAAAQAGEALDIRVAMLAMAGVRNAETQRLMEEGFRRLGLTGPMVMTGDTHAMLPSVSAASDGYCIFCGTGSGAVKVRDGEVETVADAAGYLIGDLGSGYWLGHHAAIAVASELDGRGPPTALTPAILGSLGIAITHDFAFDGRPTPLRHFIDAVYAMRPIELAKFAPLVIANRGDPVAAGLLAQSEAFLLADFRKIFDPEVRGPVVLGGSVAAHLTGLPAAIAEVLTAAGHQPDIRLAGDGAVGAAVLALRHQGVTVDEAMLQRITASMAAKAKAAAAATA
jgi:N-acetylglucosamine kinase-like BadF-type ATPase